MSLKRALVALGLAAAVIGTVPAAQSQAPAQEAEEPDWATYPWPWTQPDEEGDADQDFADIVNLSATTLPNGTVVFRMAFVDLGGMTLDNTYCIFFKVGDSSYQGGARVRAVNGAMLLQSGCSWQNSGDQAGTTEVDVTNDQIITAFAPDSIPGLVGGTFKEVSVAIGTVIVAAGSTTFWDELTPSVDPVDYPQGLAPATNETGNETIAAKVTLSADKHKATAMAGSDATFTVTASVDGPGEAEYDLTTDGLPPGFETEITPPNGTVDANATVTHNISILVPEQARAGAYPFVLAATGAANNATLNLTLNVTATSEETPTPPTGDESEAGNETPPPKTEEEERTPGPGVGLVAGALALAAMGRRRRAQRSDAAGS